ncbi:hypothetical protein V8E36_005179 [Tilletia maclaganii]
MPVHPAARISFTAAPGKAAPKPATATSSIAKSPKPANKPATSLKPPTVGRTLRARVAVGPGATRKDAIVVASSQETSGSDSTTPSSHQEDTQQTDAEYDPEAGTPPLDSQEIDMEEEIDDLVKDPHTTDVEMENFEQAQLQAGPNADGTAGEGEDRDGEDDGAPGEDATINGNNTSNPPLATDTCALAAAAHTGETDNAAPSRALAGAKTTAQKDYQEVDYPLYDGWLHETPSITWSEALEAAAALAKQNSDHFWPLCSQHTITNGSSFNVAKDIKFMRQDAKQRWNNLNRELGVDFKQISVKPLPQHGPRRRILVQYADKADFERVRQLKFYLQPRNANIFYHADAYGSALEATKRVVTLDVNPTEEIGDVFAAVREWEQAQDRIKVTDLWAQRMGDVTLATASGEPDGDEVEFTGLIIAVCQYIPPTNSSKTRTLSATDLLWFPAFIMVSGSAMETNFHGRPEWCRGCRDGRFHYFHREQDCPTPRCSDCHKRHTVGDCQRKRRRVERREVNHNANQPTLATKASTSKGPAGSKLLPPPVPAQTVAAVGTSSTDKGKQRAITPPPSVATTSAATPATGTPGRGAPGRTSPAKAKSTVAGSKGKAKANTPTTPQRAAGQTAVTDYYGKSPSHGPA